MKSVVIWVRQTRKTEVELSLERDALRIYALPSINMGLSNSRQSSSNSVGAIANVGSENSSTPAPVSNLLASILFANVIGCHRMKGRSADDRASYFTVYAYPFRGSSDSSAKSSFTSTVPSDASFGRNSASSNALASAGADGGAQSKNGDNHVKKSGRRERRCYTFQIRGKYVYDDNASYVKNWVEAIRARITGEEAPHLRPAALIQNVQVRQRRLYVLVNPHSGPGRALEIFQDRVMPVFAEANIACRLIVTERANHAQDLVRQLNLSEWDGIVIVSGDGLLYEVINGLAKRPDRESALKIPVGAIPGGSGNALAVATCFGPSDAIKGDFAVDAAVMVARPIYRPMRLIRVEMYGHRIWSFISVGWGLLSDIDIESERFRRTLGSARFTAGACIRVLNLRRYRARISYVPADSMPAQAATAAASASSTPVVVDIRVHQGDQNGFSRLQSSEGGTQSTTSASQPVFNSGSFTLEKVQEGRQAGPGPVQRAKSVSPFSANRIRSGMMRESDGGPELVAATPCSDSSGSPFQVRFDLESTPSLQQMASSKSSNSLACSSTAPEIEILEDSKGDIVRMPKIDEAVPSDWKVIEDEFIFFYAVYLNHIGAEVPYMPCSRLDDQIIYLTFIRTSTVTRTQLIRFLYSMEHAEHVKMPFFEVIPAKAFRLDRLSVGSSDIVAVDGELIKDVQGPIQACVSNYAATVMTSR